MNPDARFTFLYELLKDNYDGYSHYIFATTSAILLILGWLLTSGDARAYIAKHSQVKIPMLFGIVFFIAAEVYFSLGAMCHSRDILALLGKTLTDPDILQVCRQKQVPPLAVAIFITAHTVLYLIVATVLWSISGTKGAADS
jgi:hypothetical protein